MFFTAMLFFKGVLVSMAGPTPNYAIQHVLSTRSPREAALENMMMALVSLAPRFLLIAGISVLAIVFFQSDLAQLVAAKGRDAEVRGNPAPRLAPQLYPGRLQGNPHRRPVGLVHEHVCLDRQFWGRLCRQRHLQTLHQSQCPAAPLCGPGLVHLQHRHPPGHRLRLRHQGRHSVTRWITSALIPAFVIPNVLKWHWWRFNGYGFFAGMAAGTGGALVVPRLLPHLHEVFTFLSSWP